MKGSAIYARWSKINNNMRCFEMLNLQITQQKLKLINNNMRCFEMAMDGMSDRKLVR